MESEESRALEEVRTARAQRQDQSAPPRPSTEVLGGNIHALHMHIKGLSSQCSLRTVEAVKVFKLHQSLLETAEQVRRHAVGLTDSAEAALTARRREVEAVRRDARAGAVYLQVLQQGVSRVQVRLMIRNRHFTAQLLCLLIIAGSARADQGAARPHSGAACSGGGGAGWRGSRSGHAGCGAGGHPAW